MHHLQYYCVGVGLCQILLYSRYKRECEIQEGWRRTAEVHNKQFLSEQRWWTAVWNHHSSRTCVNAFMWVWRSGRSTCELWDVGAAMEGGISFLPFCSHLTSSSFMDGYENVNHIYEYVQTRTFYPRTYGISILRSVGVKVLSYLFRCCHGE